MIITKRPTHEEFIQSVNKYIESLKAMNPEEAKKIALDALKQSGVLDENGNTKETIVTGGFFGAGKG